MFLQTIICRVPLQREPSLNYIRILVHPCTCEYIRTCDLLQGIWAGMIFGGTFIQTLILALITIRCDWEKEVRHINASHVVVSQD